MAIRIKGINKIESDMGVEIVENCEVICGYNIYLTYNGAILAQRITNNEIIVFEDNIIEICCDYIDSVYGLDADGVLWVYPLNDSPIIKYEILRNVAKFDILKICHDIDENNDEEVLNVAWLDNNDNLYIATENDFCNPIKVEIQGVVNFELLDGYPWHIVCVCDNGKIVEVNHKNEHIPIDTQYAAILCYKSGNIYLDINGNLRNIAPNEDIILQNIKYFRGCAAVSHDNVEYMIYCRYVSGSGYIENKAVKHRENSNLYRNYESKTFAKSARN
jgi:hypothetical protein